MFLCYIFICKYGLLTLLTIFIVFDLVSMRLILFWLFSTGLLLIVVHCDQLKEFLGATQTGSSLHKTVAMSFGARFMFDNHIRLRQIKSQFFIFEQKYEDLHGTMWILQTQWIFVLLETVRSYFCSCDDEFWETDNHVYLKIPIYQLGFSEQKSRQLVLQTQ